MGDRDARRHGPRGRAATAAGTALLLLTALCGAGVTLSSLPWSYDVKPPHPGWVARYERLRPQVGSEPLAVFLSDPRQGRSKYRMFRAQYVLAPTIFEAFPELSRLPPELLTERPLVLDYGRPTPLTRDLEELRARAEAAGLDLRVARLPGQIAVVRASRRP